jgi:hypothetical protein
VVSSTCWTGAVANNSSAIEEPVRGHPDLADEPAHVIVAIDELGDGARERLAIAVEDLADLDAQLAGCLADVRPAIERRELELQPDQRAARIARGLPLRRERLARRARSGVGEYPREGVHGPTLASSARAPKAHTTPPRHSRRELLLDAQKRPSLDRGCITRTDTPRGVYRLRTAIHP